MTNALQSTTSSSSSSSSSKNLLRISGMASGIDTDSVVKSMVSNYQAKIDKENQAKQTLQWKQDAYRDIIKGVKGLQDYFNPTSSKYILGDSATNINTATSDATSIVSATASSTAKPGNYSIEVGQLAEQAEIVGKPKDSLIDVKGVTDWSKVVLEVGSKTIDFSSLKTTATSDEAVAAINSQLASESTLAGISASYVSDGTSSYIKFTNTSSNSVTVTASNSVTNTVLGGSGSNINSGISANSKLVSDLKIPKGTGANGINITVNGKNVQLDVDDSTTLQNLMDKVKSATGGDVTMSVDDTTGAILFQSKGYGTTSSVKLSESGSSSVLSTLGIPTSIVNGNSTSTANGKDAIVKITEPGKGSTVTTQTSNQFTVNGMSYNITNTNVGNPANITVTANTDKVITNIKNFINDYNTIISTINTKLTEKKDKDYPPLTDDQKSSMSESQITAWESKAKVGILRNDDNLTDMMTQLRGIFSTPIYADATTNTKVPLSLGKYGSNSIGIDTSSDVTDGGKLVIADETKLRDVIANNMDDFKKMFTGISDKSLATDASGNTTESYIGSNEYKEDGIFTRMNTILRDYVAAPGIGTDGTYTLSGSMNIFVNKQYDYSISGTSSKNTLPDQVYGKASSITKLKAQMSDAENRYYAQFTALETAMTKLNSQQSQLSSMLGNA